MRSFFVAAPEQEEAEISTSVLNEKLCIQSDPAPLFYTNNKNIRNSILL
jgi:hypothetical protein